MACSGDSAKSLWKHPPGWRNCATRQRIGGTLRHVSGTGHAHIVQIDGGNWSEPTWIADQVFRRTEQAHSLLSASAQTASGGIKDDSHRMDRFRCLTNRLTGSRKLHEGTDETAMAFNAAIVNVMIASPGDVARERVIAREVIHEWNAINALDRKLVLLPIGWDSHSAPSMTDSPQAVINSQVLKQADLLIAIFWTRLGTPTGEFASGTVEEIERHIAAGKPAMIYFSSAPVTPDSISPLQYASLVEFRDSLKKRGLVSFYEDYSAFRGDLFRHLSQTVIREYAPNQGELSASAPPNDSGPKLSDPARELLLEAVKDRGGRIMHFRYLGGEEIQTNGRNFIDENSPRAIARWTSALDELESLGLIYVRSPKREVFSVTESGYAFAEALGVVPGS